MSGRKKYVVWPVVCLWICLLSVPLTGCAGRQETVYMLGASSESEESRSVEPESADAKSSAFGKGNAENAASGNGETKNSTFGNGAGNDADASGSGNAASEDTERTEGSNTTGNAGADRNGETVNGKQTGTIFVYVCGAVAVPGVYELPEGSRVYEAVAAAGGLLPEADERCLNQAVLLTDGLQITVFTREETAGKVPAESMVTGMTGDAAAGGTADSGTGKVNLNTADKEELMTLPGIGAARAESIIRYRTENGSFSSIEDIQNIEGIKAKAFEKIKDYIEV
ncbi:MAG: ComEA family DNA-binding protein [Eubacteriales bacterium]|nr:ComEA family DNA-binding protein [Eubacteriales bacterium]